MVGSVYCAVRTDSLYKADYVSSLKVKLRAADKTKHTMLYVIRSSRYDHSLRLRNCEEGITAIRNGDRQRTAGTSLSLWYLGYGLGNSGSFVRLPAEARNFSLLQ